MKQLSIVRAVVCLIFSALICETNTFAQCPGNRPLQSMSYDTSIIGGGNSESVFRLPQFEMPPATLMSVKIETSVTLRYSFQMENDDPDKSYSQKFRIARSEEIAFGFEEFQKVNIVDTKAYALAASDGVKGSGPDYAQGGPITTILNNTYNIEDIITPFLGNDSVDVAYKVSSGAYATGNTTNTSTTQTQELIYIKVTYFFCQPFFLAADIMQFTAVRLANESIQMNWVSPNDYAGRKYVIEKSADGKTFTDVQALVTGSTPSTNKQFFYHPAKDEKNKIFFRVKQLEPDGNNRYSSIRQVNLDLSESSMRVYPTIAKDVVKIMLPLTSRGDFRVSIFSTTGQVMQQSDFFKSYLLVMPFSRKLPAGMYIVSVFNKRTSETKQSKIVVQ